MFDLNIQYESDVCWPATRVDMWCLPTPVCPSSVRCLSYFLNLLSSSPAVAERPHDASCLSVVSFNSTIRRAQSSIIGFFGFKFTAAYNYIMFCSLLFVVVVHAGCGKQDSLMRGGLCGKLYGGPSQLLLARPAVMHPIGRYWPIILLQWR